MQRTARKAVMLALAGSMVIGNAQAGSVMGNGGATEVTQILNNVQLVQETAQTYQQIQQLAQQLQYMQSQLQNLAAAPQQIWGQAQQDLTQLTQLTQLVSQSQTLAYAAGNGAQQFQQNYPGFAATAGATNYGQQYSTWINNSLSSVSAALQSAGFQANNFASEQAALQSIRNISAGSPGALQAIQAGNMIASNQADQLMQLRQLMTAQMGAQDSYIAARQQVQANQTNAAQTVLMQGNGTVRQWGQSGFVGYGPQ